MTDPVNDWLRLTRPQGALVAYSRLSEQWSVDVEATSAVAWHIILEGEAWLHIGDARRLLRAGEMILLTEGPPHRLAANTDPKGSATTMLRGEYSGSRCPITSIWSGLPAIIHVTALTSNAAIMAVLTLIIAELDAPSQGSEPIVGALLDALMVYAFRAWAHSEDGAGTWAAGVDDPLLSGVIRQIHRSPADAWSLEALARNAGLSRSAFARHFSERMGEPPMEYVRRLRMAIAARMLLDGAPNMAQVAEQVGYQSEFAFNRAFKRVMGQSPGRFRQSWSSGEAQQAS